MNRRDFIKRTFLVSLGLTTFSRFNTTYAAMKKVSNQRLSLLRKVTVKMNHFQKMGTAHLTLTYQGTLPEEIKLIVTNKGGTIIGTGPSIYPTHPSAADKIKHISNLIREINVTLSPELIDHDKNVYLDLNHRGEGFKLLNATIKVSEPLMLENYHSIEGYSPKVSYFPEEVIELKVHSPYPKFSVDFISYGADEHIVQTVKNITGYRQNYPEYAYRNGVNWLTSLHFKIPKQWSTGLYAARLYDNSGKDFYVSFNLKQKIDPLLPKEKRIAILSSTNTWQAYNTWGGGSLYKYLIENDLKPIHGQIVNTQRPNEAATPIGNPEHLANAEKLILAWLERNGYPFHVISDPDLHNNPNLLQSFGTLIINTHGEYWSKQMYKGLESFLKNGGNLLCLSGNAIYWKVVQQGDQIEARKIFGYHTLNGERGGLWRNLGLPESKILGALYTPKGYMTFKPYQVINPNHWIFTNTNLKKGDLIGSMGLNRGGASGHETDKRDKSSPKNIVLLAKGTNPNNGGAEMVYYDHPGGGGVFSVGSITFGGSLAIDPNLTQIVKNVLNRFTNPKGPHHEK
ncbi:hypothetical protein SAMN05444392_10189 [Seinonella peptonophila]|uniref:N,N-dimethylformamidase beta subunit-like C-terminal domain-containing protein n=1 Tax=Seinonella peptonophila TaxID=112248 RepID=A0A1M4SQJ7_9BACL|nr:N,N-dimethylformamidase beta subunit family domain-containing protein [Seinonella peptonophila]SHE34459.1 hypothetical protein SAMN05444392_10189 [Seinonella peptonophila]